jgi:sterol desaturase/sphingolipid hydroxylase (fatty acid hydroxylase superfamily)
LSKVLRNRRGRAVTDIKTWLVETALRFWNGTPVGMWLSFLAIGIVVEFFLRAERGQSFRQVLFNVRYSAIYLLAIFLLAPTLSLAVSGIAQRIGMGWFDIAVFSSTNVLHQIAAAVLSVILIDFFYYWFHRAQHRFGWLWDQHAIHHSEEALNISTSARHHWTEFLFQGVAITLPIMVLFKQTPRSIWIISMVAAFWTWFIHMNIRLRLGPFAYLICAPQVHRIHHSRLPEHQNKNFAAYFPMWDVLFGTYYAPKPGEYPPTGLADGRRIATVTQAAVYPFVCWARRAAAAVKAWQTPAPQ